MANPQRGEVSLTVNDKSYTLVIDLSAICQLEEVFSTADTVVTWEDIISAILRQSRRHIRGFLWVALRRHHKEISLAQTTKLIEDAGGIDAIFETILKTKKASEPDVEDLQTGRPQLPRQAEGTGAGSTSTPGASA